MGADYLVAQGAMASATLIFTNIVEPDKLANILW